MSADAFFLRGFFHIDGETPTIRLNVLLKIELINISNILSNLFILTFERTSSYPARSIRKWFTIT